MHHASSIGAQNSFRKGRKRTTDIIFHLITKSQRLHVSEEVDLRTKISFLPTETIGPALQRIEHNLLPFLGEKADREWCAVLYRGEEGIEIEPDKKLSEFPLTNANKEKDIFFVEKKQWKKEKEKKKPRRRGVVTPSTICERALSGETIYYQFSAYCVTLGTDEHQKEKVDKLKGDIYLSNYRVKFFADSGATERSDFYIDIPLGTISKIEKRRITDERKERIILYVITCKDFREVTFGWEDAKQEQPKKDVTKSSSNLGPAAKKPGKEDYKTFQKFVLNAHSHNHFQAPFMLFDMEDLSLGPKLLDGWHFHDAKVELERQGIEQDQVLWAVLEKPNLPSDVPEWTLPKWTIITQGALTASEDLLFLTLKQRHNGRFPTYVWGAWKTKHSLDQSALLRADRSVLPEDKVERRALSYGDKMMLKFIGILNTLYLGGHGSSVDDDDGLGLSGLDTSPVLTSKSSTHDLKKKLVQVIDTGKGNHDQEIIAGIYKEICEFSWLGLPTWEELQECHDNLFAVCVHQYSDAKFYQKIRETQWPQYEARYLREAHRVVTVMRDQKGIVILQNGGPEHDDDYLLVSLVQILIDPYFRTIEGFCKLIDKDWVQYSFPFFTRMGHSVDEKHVHQPRGKAEKEKDKTKGQERVQWTRNLPCFEMFLNCVWQLLQMEPTAFEFTEDFLLFLLDSLYDRRFGTFFFDTEERRLEFGIDKKALSIWSYVLLLRPSQFNNQFFDPADRKSVV